MTENKPEIVCVIDRSGSMLSIVDDAIGGFNKFLDDQKNLNKDARMTLVQFDHCYDIIHDNVDVMNAKPYTRETYVPRGSTALYDAVGKTIAHITSRASTDADKHKVLFMILTDGHENSSNEYSLSNIKSAIEQRKKDGWDFIFVGAGLDSFDVSEIGKSMGIGINNIHSVQHNGLGMSGMFNSISRASVSFCNTGSVGEDWVDRTGCSDNNRVDFSWNRVSRSKSTSK